MHVSKTEQCHNLKVNIYTCMLYICPLSSNHLTIQEKLTNIIIHQTHYEKSDWSRAFNQFTIACELDMINAISAADIAFIMSSSMSAWLPIKPLGVFSSETKWLNALLLFLGMNYVKNV